MISEAVIARHLHADVRRVQSRRVATRAVRMALWLWVALTRAAASETWVSGIPVVDESGDVDWGTGAFVLSFVLVVNWTLLQGLRS